MKPYRISIDISRPPRTALELDEARARLQNLAKLVDRSISAALIFLVPGLLYFVSTAFLGKWVPSNLVSAADAYTVTFVFVFISLMKFKDGPLSRWQYAVETLPSSDFSLSKEWMKSSPSGARFMEELEAAPRKLIRAEIAALHEAAWNHHAQDPSSDFGLFNPG